MKKVGDTLIDGWGREWTVSRVHSWESYNDLELFDMETGERGSVREPKDGLTP